MRVVNTSINPGSIAWAAFLAMGARLENSPTWHQPAVHEELKTFLYLKY